MTLVEFNAKMESDQAFADAFNADLQSDMTPDAILEKYGLDLKSDEFRPLLEQLDGALTLEEMEAMAGGNGFTDAMKKVGDFVTSKEGIATLTGIGVAAATAIGVVVYKKYSSAPTTDFFDQSGNFHTVLEGYPITYLASGGSVMNIG